MQCTYKCNMDARSRNHCYRAKAINIITYSCACAILSHVPSPTLLHFPYFLINGTIFRGGGGIIGHKMYVFIFSTNFVHISHSKNSVRYYHNCTKVVMYSTHYSCQILVKHFQKNIKLYEGLSSGSRFAAYRRKDGLTDERTWRR